MLGVLTVDFNLNFLSDFIGQLHFGKLGKVFMFDQDRHVIAFPGLRLIENAGQGTARKAADGSDVADPVFQAFRRAQGIVDRGAVPGAQADQSYVAGYRRLKVAGGPTWFLGAYAPESDFLGVLAGTKRPRSSSRVVALCIGHARHYDPGAGASPFLSLAWPRKWRKWAISN